MNSQTKRVAKIIAVVLLPIALVVTILFVERHDSSAVSLRAAQVALEPAAESADPVVRILITDAGFTPDNIIVPEGTEVIWYNDTSQAVTITGTRICYTYLPVITKQVIANQRPETKGDQNGPLPKSPTNNLFISAAQSNGDGDWGSGPIDPGEEFSHTFLTACNYPYHLVGQPTVEGLVVVVPPSPPTAPDLALVKDDGGVVPAAGDVVTYVLTYTNKKNQLAPGVVITETIPGNASFNPGASSAGWQQVGSSDTYVYTVGTLPNRSNGSVNLALTIDDPLPLFLYTITNTAKIGDDGSNGPDATPGDNIATEVTKLDNQPDLVIDKSDIGSAEPGDTINYTISYSNAGDRPASGVIITETLPANTTYNAGGSSAGWQQVGGTDTYVYNINDLATGAGDSITFAVDVDNPVSPGVNTIVNTVLIGDDGSHGIDGNPDDNTDVVTTSLDIGPDLVITKTDHDIAAFAGTLIKYTITYTNTGNQSSNGVVITEVLPNNTNYNAGQSSAGWSQVGSTKTYIYNVGTLNVDAGDTIIFAVNADDPLPDDVTPAINTVTISDDGSQGPDLNPADNTDTVKTPMYLGPTEVCVTIFNDTTWTQRDSPYILTCDFMVAAGATLTLEPGTVVKPGFEDNDPLKPSDWNMFGTLLSQGTDEWPVYVTSIKDDSLAGDSNGDGSATVPAPGDWARIAMVDTSVGLFDHTQLRYGGRSTFFGGIVQVRDQSSVTMTNSIIEFSETNGIKGAASDPNISASLTLSNTSVLNSGENGIWMRPTGLNALNVFNSTFKQTSLAYGILAETLSTATISNTTFIDSAREAVKLDFAQGAVADISGVTGSGNNPNVIALGGTLGGNSTLASNALPYRLVGLAVSPGSSLTVQPGAIFKQEGILDSLVVSGTLNVQGTLSQPVYFTSLKDDSVGGDTNGDGNSTSPAIGDWGNVNFGNSSGNTITYARFQYGGKCCVDGVLSLDNSTVSVVNSVISGSQVDGIDAINGSNLTVSNSTVQNAILAGINIGSSSVLDIQDTAVLSNNDEGLRFESDAGTPAAILNNSFVGNTDYGIFNGGVTVITAENNWWGSATGPTPPGTGDAINETVYATPWLTSDPN